jgi:hypothetical protein
MKYWKEMAVSETDPKVYVCTVYKGAQMIGTGTDRNRLKAISKADEIIQKDKKRSGAELMRFSLDKDRRGHNGVYE